MAQVVVDAVRRLVPSDRSAVWSWLPERDAIQILAVGAGTDVLGLSIGDVVPIDDDSIRVVLEQGVSRREADLGRHASRREQALAAGGLRSRLIVPILVNGVPIGVLSTMRAGAGSTRPRTSACWSTSRCTWRSAWSRHA